MDMRSCRECRFYMRVKKKKDSVFDLTNCQGFCVHGQLIGDFSLYISTNKSTECLAYVLSDVNKEIYDIERRLDSWYYDFRHKCVDKRTKEYKFLKKRFTDDDELNRLFGKSYGGRLFPHTYFNEKLVEVLNEIHRDKHIEEYKILLAYKRILYTDYLKLISGIAELMFREWVDAREWEWSDEFMLDKI